ncbi:MAG TPA: hypothetical protein VGO24_01330 [Solirubrobacterales bacterium]|nr:hypothetical protein [Solirubrobacterales bacterium]
MPRRTNTFQQVIKLVYELMADDAEVEESVMLKDYETDGEREVDVLITGDVGGFPLRVHIEATARAEPADVKWVEAELGKHRAVRTDHLVLVSESGFSKDAKQKAEANGATVIEPRDLTSEDSVGEVVNRLGSVWPKQIGLAPTAVEGIVYVNDAPAHANDLTLDTWIVADDGRELGSIREEIERRFNQNFAAVAEQIGLSEIAGDVEAYFTLLMVDWEGEWQGRVFPACLRWQPDPDKPPEFHQIVRLRVIGKAAISVDEVRLTHTKLGEFLVAYGTGEVGGKDTLVVFAETKDNERGAMRIDGGNQTLKSDT